MFPRMYTKQTNEKTKNNNNKKQQQKKKNNNKKKQKQNKTKTLCQIQESSFGAVVCSI